MFLIIILFLANPINFANSSQSKSLLCFKQGQIKKLNQINYVCINSGKKLQWVKESSLKFSPGLSNPIKTTPTPTPAPVPSWFSKVQGVNPNKIFSYQTFDDEMIQLYPWEGKSVAILTKSNDLDPMIMGKILTALDMSYETYKEITNFTPASGKTYNGKLLIAEIPQSLKSCGAGCGYLGVMGIQIYDSYFLKLYNDVKNRNQFDQVLFYELGRNFWNYNQMTPKLAFKENDPVVTGFAILMRFEVMERNNIPMSDFWGAKTLSASEFRKGIKNLFDLYEKDNNLNFSNTFTANIRLGLFGTSDLWASIMMHLKEMYGREFLKKFFTYIPSLPNTSTTGESVKNWEIAASMASGVDLESQFKSWKLVP